MPIIIILFMYIVFWSIINPWCSSLCLFVCFSYIMYLAGCIQNKGVSPKYKQQWEHLPWHLEGAMEPCPYHFQGICPVTLKAPFCVWKGPHPRSYGLLVIIMPSFWRLTYQKIFLQAYDVLLMRVFIFSCFNMLNHCDIELIDASPFLCISWWVEYTGSITKY